MPRLRTIAIAIVGLTLVGAPAWSAKSPTVTPLGTVIAADRAKVGQASADVGTTVYGGDVLSTELQGSVQVRAGAARLLLLSYSQAMVNDNEGSPSARLLRGSANFSTGNARAFTLFASTAAIRSQTDAPTIGQVTFVNEKELVVTARRGGLSVTVEGETQLVNEGQSFRVLLDPAAAAAQEPAGAGAGQGPAHGSGGGPLKAGRSRFLILAVGLTAAGTGVAIYESLESPSRP